MNSILSLPAGWRIAACLIPALFCLPVAAENYPLPAAGSDVIGETAYTNADKEDTLLDIARRFSLGQDEIVLANRKVDRWYPGEGTPVLLPKMFILPNVPRTGVVLNVPEMRLFYFRRQGKQSGPVDVVTYPVSIGRMDWKTPRGTTTIVQKLVDPPWRPPETIKKEHAANGDFLPDVVPPGPNNPLGRFAMKLGIPGYLIHGTGIDKAFGIGMRVTHGCVRMYPEDVEQLFPLVPVGSPVHITNEPVKVGWHGQDMYIEVHPPLKEDFLDFKDNPPQENGEEEDYLVHAPLEEGSPDYQRLLSIALDLIQKKVGKNAPPQINPQALKAAVKDMSGVPVLIAHPAPPVVEPEPESGL